MRGFPGQLSNLGLQGTQATTWTLAPFFLKSFQAVVTNSIDFFRGLLP